MPEQITPSTPEQASFLKELLAAGLLIATGVPGVYGHGPEFEQIRGAIGERISEQAAARGAEPLRFPPLMPRHTLEANGYLGSFPHLAGTVFSFNGSEEDAAALARLAAAHEDWSDYQEMTDVSLVPAACYPIYPAMAAQGPLPAGGRFVDMGPCWVFRNEPSLDPARRQIFHQHELVRLGEAGEVADWRDQWSAIGLEFLGSLGLDARLDNATDPFFGRRGRMLAASQRDQQLKLELLVQIAGPEPTAVASFNQHRDHFGTAWGIELADGEVAHTACAGFGHERLVLALLKRHGLGPDTWPREVRDRLWG